MMILQTINHFQSDPRLALLFNAAADCLSVARFAQDNDPQLARSMTMRARELIEIATRFDNSGQLQGGPETAS
jgi:hypothetical protein